MGYNCLLVFSWVEVIVIFDCDLEEILIQQFDWQSWYNGGGLFFGKDGMFYFLFGDEGGGFYEEELI